MSQTITSDNFTACELNLQYLGKQKFLKGLWNVIQFPHEIQELSENFIVDEVLGEVYQYISIRGAKFATKTKQIRRQKSTWTVTQD